MIFDLSFDLIKKEKTRKNNAKQGKIEIDKTRINTEKVSTYAGFLFGGA